MVEVIDASGLIIGRLASHVAKKLLDDKEAQVEIIHAEKAIISGNRTRVIRDFIARRKLNHPRKGPNFPRMPDRILKRTIRGMIPYQTPRGRDAYSRLKVHIGVPRDLEGKKTKIVDGAINKGIAHFVELDEISKILGAKY